MKSFEFTNIVRHITGITARIDVERSMIEYIGLGLTERDLTFKTLPQDKPEGESIIIPANSSVTYVLQEYTNDHDGIVSVCTVLKLNFVYRDVAARFTCSLNMGIDTAAQIYGLTGFRKYGYS